MKQKVRFINIYITTVMNFFFPKEFFIFKTLGQKHGYIETEQGIKD